MARRLARGAGRIVRVKYFTALVYPSGRDPTKQQRQTTYIAAIRSLPDVQVIYGRHRRRWMDCRVPRAKRKGCTEQGWPYYQEKQTDVNIAIEIINDAHDDAFDAMLLVSRDGDLARILRAIKSKFAQKRIVLASPPGPSSADLPRYAHSHIHITNADFNACRLPVVVTLKSRKQVARPKEWV